MKNFYDILGIGRNASKAEIKKAYINELRKYHPDVTKFDKLYAEERTKDIVEAFEVLNDDEKRAAYDELLSGYEKLNNIHSSDKKKAGFSEKEKQSKNAPPSKPNNSMPHRQNKARNNMVFVVIAVIICVIGGLFLGSGKTKKTVPNKTNAVNVSPTIKKESIKTESIKKENSIEAQAPNTPVFNHDNEKKISTTEPYNKMAKKIEVVNDFAIGKYRIGMPIKSIDALQADLGNIVSTKQEKYRGYTVNHVEYQHGRITVNGVGNLSAIRIKNIDKGMATPRNIKIGSYSRDVLSAYGKPGKRSKNNLYTYPGGDGSEIYFFINNGKVVEMGFYYPYC